LVDLEVESLFCRFGGGENDIDMASVNVVDTIVKYVLVWMYALNVGEQVVCIVWVLTVILYTSDTTNY